MLLSFFFQLADTFLLLLLNLCKRESWVSPACLALPQHSTEGGVIAGEGNCTHGDNNSLFIGMRPRIPAKPQVGRQGSETSAVLARRATKPLPPSPPGTQAGGLSPHGNPPLPLQEEPGGHLAPESQGFLHPRADGSLPQSGAVPCPPRKAQTSL